MKKKIDYRHFITIFITLGFVAFGFLFPNAIPRLYESCRNILLSIGYSFVKIADPSNDSFIVTVLNMPSIEFAPSPWKPLFSITWEEFKTLVYTYFSAFTLKENLMGYLYIVLNTVYYIVRFSTPLILFILIIKRVLAIFTAGTNNNDNVDSKPLKVFKWILKHVFGPVWFWVKEYVLFLRGTAIYLKIWAWIWALHLNIISIVVDFFAYFFYFSASFAVESLWSQVQKFVFDISPMVRFFPAWVWIILISYGYARICRNIAYSALYHRERMNRGFINERGVVSIVYGSMGVGKTALITDMALSAEVELRDRAFRILLECDLKYPCFPWSNFRTELKKAIEDRRIIDVRSAERWVVCIKRDYTALQISKTDKAMSKAWRRHVEKNPPKYLNLLFDYEEDFGMTYNDKLKVSSIFETLSEYAAAYFVYTVQSSLIISNYSIRVDSLMIDMGNMPIWDADFFKRDARLLDSYSRHSKILDFDMLRLGTRMLADNPNRNAFGFGVYVISEIDKERKNGMDIAAMKIKTEECNQRNDLFNACLKMSRHACVIANKVFVKILCDLQRPEDWGAGGREVGEIIFIEKEGDLVPTLPVFSIFWLLERIYVRLKEKFDSFYTNFIVQRSDNTLSVFLLKWIFSKFEQYFDGVNNTFGAQTIVDYGFDFYAPQTFEKEPILIAWLNMWDRSNPSEEYGFAGQLTVARRLSRVDGRLYQTPVFEGVQVAEKCNFTRLNDTFTIGKITLDLQGLKSLNIKLRKKGDNYASFDLQSGQWVFNRSKCGKQIAVSETDEDSVNGIRRMPAIGGKTTHVEIVSDLYSLEIFVDGMAMSSLVYPDRDADGLEIIVDAESSIYKKFEIERQ